MAPVPWPAAASFVAAAGTGLLVSYLRRYRDKPGAGWFLASLSYQAVWSVAYGVALLTFAEPGRWALEVLSWGAMAGTGVCFLAFALAYTGRGGVVERWRQGFLVFPLVIALVGATNPVHGLVWVDFRVVPVAGMAGATYEMRLWAVVAATVGVSAISVGSLLLFDTVVSYGPLYRREAVAVGLSTVPPVAGVLVWLYGVGPVPEVSFATVTFLPHVALDAYAFVGNDMFEFHPATRRAGERAAIDDLGAPVVVVDEQERVVALNTAAETAFGVAKSAALTRPLGELLGECEIDPTVAESTVTVRDGGRQTVYAVTSTALSDAGGTHVGYTVVFQDVTAERRREQRLDVLNRVLRHNLRNDITVIRGFTEAAVDRIDDPETRSMLDRAEAKTNDLLALGEKARTVARVLDSDRRSERVAVDDLLATVRDEYADESQGATVTVEAPAVTVTTDPAVLEVVVGTLVENALEHAGETPTVVLSAERGGGSVAVTVADDGPGIPEHELAAVTAGRESALEHGSGLGLWLVNWGATTLGGDLTFDTENGTTATVTVPDEGATRKG